MASKERDEQTKAPSRKRKLRSFSQLLMNMTEEEKKKLREKLDQNMEELNERMKHYDPVVADRTEIETQLKTGSSVFVLEVPKSARSHCKAKPCLVEEFGGSRNIESDFRLNLKDRTGERTGERSYWKRKAFFYYYKTSKAFGPNNLLEPECFYHVSCVEHIIDCSALLSNHHLLYEGGHVITPSPYGTQVRHSSLHMAIKDWFDNKGYSFDFSSYAEHKDAYEQWTRSFSLYLLHYENHANHANYAKCTCGPDPVKPVYGSEEQRKPRLLSEVLASIAKVYQIDGIPISWLEYLKAPVDCTEEYENIGTAHKQENQEPEVVADKEAERVHVTRKPTDVEVKERRQELVEMIRKRKEKEHMEQEKVLGKVVANKIAEEHTAAGGGEPRVRNGTGEKDVLEEKVAEEETA